MATINIDRSNMDPFYRYKMPRLLAKVEGKGNGIKTVIVNMTEIAKALSRPPTYPTKYFGCELGAQTQFDTKNDRYIVNGSHDADRLQNLLDGFIKKFVLCDECSNPETNLIVSVKKGMITRRCIACGHTSNVDMRHKLTTFILKNPDDETLQATTPSKGKKSKKGKDKDERNSPETQQTAQQQMAAQRATGGTIDVPPEQLDGGDDDDWGEDFSEEAVKQRMDELSGAAKGLALTDDLEKTDKDRMDILYKLIKDKRDSGALKTSAGVKEVVAEAERLEVKEKVPLVLVELLLTDKVLAQAKDHRILLLSFCKDNPKAQKYLVGGLEMLIGKEYAATLMPRVPHIFKLFYDMDILDEEVILEWAKKISKKYVSKEIAQQMREKAKPFIEWLEQASEEEEDDDEEEEEVVYSTSGQVGEQIIETPQQNGKKVDDDEDDFDIDDI